MGIVSSVEENRGLVFVCVDGRTLCRIRAKDFKLLPVREGEEIDEENYLDRLSAAQFSSAYESALCMLDRSAKSSREIERALLRKGFVPGAAEAALDRLHSAHLIDDARYAQHIVESQKKKPVGRYALRRKLLSKGVKDEDVENALEAMDDDQQLDAALALARKFLSRYEDEKPYVRRGKLSQALARRGFSWDVVSSAVERVLTECDEEP